MLHCTSETHMYRKEKRWVIMVGALSSGIIWEKLDSYLIGVGAEVRSRTRGMAAPCGPDSANYI